VTGTAQAWIVMAAVAVPLLTIDLISLRRHHGETSMRTAARQSALWLGAGIAFGGYVYFHFGRQGALEYYTGFLIEKSLSVDNLFVFLAIFHYFAIERRFQSRLLFIGILGAIVFRGIFIFGGSYLLEKIDWMVYVFGIILLLTAVRLAKKHDEEVHPEKNLVVLAAKRLLPVTARLHDQRFVFRENGRLVATPLLLAVITIETSDIMFAIDSVPAILAITRNTFIVYSSNLFAILGLRALYFFLAEIVQRFRFLSYAIAAILAWVGIKMLAHNFVKIPTIASLGVVGGAIAVGVILSMLIPEKPHQPAEAQSLEHSDE
jgi:tellurite resistance protein TerC